MLNFTIEPHTTAIANADATLILEYTNPTNTPVGQLLALHTQTDVHNACIWHVAVGGGSSGEMILALQSIWQMFYSRKPRSLVVQLPPPSVALKMEMGAEKAANDWQQQQKTIKSIAMALSDCAYAYSTTKSTSTSKASPLESVTLRFTALTDDTAYNLQSLNALQNHINALVAGVDFAKEWANRPANHCTPTLLGKAAKTLSNYPNIDCEVLGPKEAETLGMGSFMAVAQGAKEPLRFIVLEYNGIENKKTSKDTKDAAPSKPIVLIGKGITFDTGGISLKPASEMDEMKFDMCGAASVLGVFKALGELQPAIHVVGLVPASENMPSGKAIKPGDVVTSMSGQTIEILNTDAEGRLVLCDALTYAQRFDPKQVIDIATLTGACVIALGGVRSGLFSSNAELAKNLVQAGEYSGDLCWHMPLDSDYADALKSNFADVANVGGRAGGAITAAKFLQRFTVDKAGLPLFPWAHLDIAGTAWKSGKIKGATGRPVDLLLTHVLGLVHKTIEKDTNKNTNPDAKAKTAIAPQVEKAIRIRKPKPKSPPTQSNTTI